MLILGQERRRFVVWLVALAVLVVADRAWLDDPSHNTHAVARAQGTEPIPTRNDVAQPLGPDDEVLMLRHHRVRKDAHELFYRLSQLAIWPWFDRIGARVTGQWVVVDPVAPLESGHDDVYRLARYASFEHWRQTRGANSIGLGGNGPNRTRSIEALLLRRELQLESDGGYFLQGRTAATRPLFMPGVAGDRLERIETDQPPLPGDDIVAVRQATAQPESGELVTLVYRRIEKGAFAATVEATARAVWPFEEKLGARPIGQWKVIYPDAPSRTQESPAYDETITMTRYASHEHYLALQPGQAFRLGGDGPDWRAWRDAVAAHRELTRVERVEFLTGFLYDSPPRYMPALAERYRRVERP